MTFNLIKVVSLFLGLILTPLYAANSDHWTAFEREHKRTGLSLINHIQNLSILSSSDTRETKARKKDALSYFLATGGKNGFRKEPPTAPEYEILVKAMTVLSMLHYFREGNIPVLDLVQVRRNYGLRTEDATEQRHLVHAHAVISYTLCLDLFLRTNVLLEGTEGFAFNLNASLETISSVLKTCGRTATQVYGKPLLRLSSPWPEEKLRSSLGQMLSFTMAQIILSELAPGIAHGLMQDHISPIQALLKGCCRPLRVTPKIKHVILTNGSTVERTPDGGFRTNMFGGVADGKIIDCHGFILDGSWTDEELLEALKKVGIVDVLYS